jgi:hypothetical protein
MNDSPSPAIEYGVIIFLVAAIFLTVAAGITFWLWMLFDCLKYELPGSSQKIVWTIFIIVFGVFGAFAYNVSRRKQRIKELGR